MSISNQNIVFSGSDGSIGSQRPQNSLVVKSLLEDSLATKIAELKNLPEQPKAFIHLAAMASVKDCQENPELCFKLNVDGAREWLEACQECGVEKFIFVSTSHVYDPQACENPLTTSSPIKPHNTYGQSKWKAEQELSAQAQKQNGTQLYIARVFSVLADPAPPWSLLQGLKKRAENKDFSPIPGLSCQRDFLTNKEVCERLVQIAQSDKQLPQTINLCSGRAKTVREIAEKVFREYGLDPQDLTEELGCGGTPKIVGVPTKIN